MAIRTSSPMGSQSKHIHFGEIKSLQIMSFKFQDFGDYSDGYYSVQTADGEKIAQLIAGYIDIILKKVIFLLAFIC
jgi:hypothetical protein